MCEPKSPILRELKAEWVREAKQSVIVNILVDRFGAGARRLKTKLKPVEDRARLVELLKFAFTCPDLASFRKQLSSDREEVGVPNPPET
jgi:hypothetical protein